MGKFFPGKHAHIFCGRIFESIVDELVIPKFKDFFFHNPFQFAEVESDPVFQFLTLDRNLHFIGMAVQVFALAVIKRQIVRCIEGEFGRDQEHGKGGRKSESRKSIKSFYTLRLRSSRLYNENDSIKITDLLLIPVPDKPAFLEWKAGLVLHRVQEWRC